MKENHIDKRSTNLKCKPPYIDPSNPDSIPKYIDRLPIPKKAAREICTETYDAYRITMKEAFHTFHSYFPKTKVWGYN